MLHAHMSQQNACILSTVIHQLFCHQPSLAGLILLVHNSSDTKMLGLLRAPTATRGSAIRSRCRMSLSFWVFSVTACAGSNALNFFAFWPTSSSAWKNPTPTQRQLLDLATKVRKSMDTNYPSFFNDTADNLRQKLFYPSSFDFLPMGQRGFCNWVIPNRLMIGQYPAQTPEEGGPTEEEAKSHLRTMVKDVRISLFCSLQSELPRQDDYETWGKNDGMIFLKPQHIRRRFPHPFTHYAATVNSMTSDSQGCMTYLHCPIEDLNIPESKEPLQELLLQLLAFLYDNPDKALYLHCWGGRGRAGLVGSCLISLIWPALHAGDVLRIIQTGYESRLGHDMIPLALSRSPQTDTQRDFVASFVKEYQQLACKLPE
jgi:hypothetical protein